MAARAGRSIGRGYRLLHGEETIRLNFASASSATPDDRNSLANCQANTADALRRSARLDEALAACERSLAVREPLVNSHPETPVYRAGLGETYLRLGQVRCDMKNLAGAAAALRLACEHYDATKGLSARRRFLQACCHASLAGLGGRAGVGVPAAEGADQAEKAMATCATRSRWASAPRTLIGRNHPSIRFATGLISGN